MRLAKILALAALALCMPMAALADAVTFVNTGGKIKSNAAKTDLSISAPSASMLTQISGLGMGYDAIGPNLGTVTMTTGLLTSGNLIGGPLHFATFAAGGSFEVTSTSGMGGFVFTGTFAAGATWTQSSTSPGTWTFSGTVVNGDLQLGNGSDFKVPNAIEVQVTNNGQGFITNSLGQYVFQLNGGNTNFPSPVPEPGTLTLFGSGLIGVGLFAKRRASRKTS